VFLIEEGFTGACQLVDAPIVATGAGLRAGAADGMLAIGIRRPQMARSRGPLSLGLGNDARSHPTGTTRA
jgi:hypothetical protein